MKFTKYIKSNASEIILLGFIVAAFAIYFVVYMTPSRTAWYREMRNQMIVFFEELTSIGK